MDSSNKNLPKVRKRTIISLALFTLILVGFTSLYSKIDEQSKIYGEVKVNFDRYKNEISTLEDRFSEIVDQIASKDAELRTATKTLTDVSSELKITSADNDVVQKFLDNARNKLVGVEERHRQLQADNDQLSNVQRLLDDKNQDFEELKSAVEDYEVRKDNLKKNIDEQTARLNRVNENLKALETDETKLFKRLAEADADLEIIRDNFRDLNSKGDQAQARLDRVNAELDKVQSSLDLKGPELEGALRNLSDATAQNEAKIKALKMLQVDIEKRERQLQSMFDPTNIDTDTNATYGGN